VVRSVRMSTLTAAGSAPLSWGRSFVNAVDDGDDVRARLALNIQNDGGILIGPSGLLGVFHAVDHGGDVGQTHRRAIAVGHDQRGDSCRWR